MSTPRILGVGGEVCDSIGGYLLLGWGFGALRAPWPLPSIGKYPIDHTAYPCQGVLRWRRNGSARSFSNLGEVSARHTASILWVKRREKRLSTVFLDRSIRQPHCPMFLSQKESVIRRRSLRIPFGEEPFSNQRGEPLYIESIVLSTNAILTIIICLLALI